METDVVEIITESLAALNDQLDFLRKEVARLDRQIIRIEEKRSNDAN